MARRTAEQKAADARRKLEEALAKARREYADDPDSVTAPLDAAFDWLRSALLQRKQLGKKDAHALYKQATDQLAAFARQIHDKTENGK